MTRRLLAPLAALLLAGCGGGASPDPTVAQAWIRLPAVPGRPGAAYFTVTGGAAPSRLVAVESPAAERIELHSPRMQRLDGASVAAGQKLAFAPEGNHGMAFGLSPALKAGDTTRLDFRFEKGTAVSAEAKVVAAGDDAPY